jgi:hypothetical protein
MVWNKKRNLGFWVQGPEVKSSEFRGSGFKGSEVRGISASYFYAGGLWKVC